MMREFQTILPLLGAAASLSLADVPPPAATDSDGFREIPVIATPVEAQPMTGLVFWCDQAEDLDKEYNKAIALEFAYLLPCDYVRGKSGGSVVYDWTKLEKLLDGVAGRGHQAVLRFRYEYPGSKDVDRMRPGATAVPAYIKALPDYLETFSPDPGGDGPTRYADWSNAELREFTARFYADFAARYDRDPRIAFLEVGFGHWSEYHIHGTRLQLGKNFPDKAYQTAFFRHMDSVFRFLPWVVSIDAADGERAPLLDDASLLALPFGLFDDSFMHKNHEIGSADGYNERCWNALSDAGGTPRWQKAPSGGEISYYSSRDQHEFLRAKGLYGVTWEQAAAKYHITFMVANDAPEGKYAPPERVLEASLSSGYRFRVLFFRSKEGASRVAVRNEGVAPLYKDAYVAVDGVRSAESLKGLLPGESKTFAVDAGGAAPTLAIESDFTAKRPIGFLAP